MLLDEAGSSLQDIVKVTVYLTDIRYRETVYRIMGRWLKGVYPVSTGLVVEALARPEWLVEIDATAVISESEGRRQMTFSLVARDAATGAFGIVICSSSPAVASRCAHARATVGVVASQNVTNPALGPRVLDSLAGGSDADAALKAALAHEQFPDYRQLTVVDIHGNTAVHSGAHSLGVHTHAQGDQAVAAGNLLKDEEGDLRAAGRLRRQRLGGLRRAPARRPAGGTGRRR